MQKVCLPHLVDGVSVEQIAGETALHRVDHCSIQDCLRRYCSDDARLGCIDLQPDYCVITISGNENFPDFEAEVQSILAADKAQWTRLPPTPTRAGYGVAYCNATNSVGVETFGVSPDHVPSEIERSVHAPEYEVRVSAHGEPQWCVSRRQAPNDAPASRPLPPEQPGRP